MEQSPLQRAFDRNKTFAVPAYVIEEHLDAIQHTYKRTFRVQRLTINDFEIEVYRFPGTIGKSHPRELLFGTGKLLGVFDTFDVLEGRTDDRIFPVLVPKKSSVEEFGVQDLFDKRKDKGRDKGEATAAFKEIAWKIYKKELELLSRLTGWQISFGAYRALHAEPKQKKEKRLDILLSNPPGEITSSYLRTAHGIHIHEDQYSVHRSNPTAGRGIVLKDTFGGNLVQLLEYTAYILFPIFSFYYGDQSEIIFHKTLVLIWNGLRASFEGKLKEPKERTGQKAYAEAMSANITIAPIYWQEQARDLERQMEEQRKKLRNLYQELLNCNIALKALEKSEELKARIDDLPREYTRIRKHPLVERAYIREHGLHVETKTISILHEGESYNIGRYVFRFNQRGEISIWTLETHHLLGDPHPHIRKGGSPCYGTASEAITRAAAEFRFADCCDHLFQWITNYAPETCSTKIEEWKDQTRLQQYIHGEIEKMLQDGRLVSPDAMENQNAGTDNQSITSEQPV